MKKDIEFNGQDLVNSVESFAKSLPMRELKFRVYIREKNEMVYFDFNEFPHSDRYLYSDKYPVQQYTGLKDSKGNPIYEGDIVNTIYSHDPHNCIGKVIYHDEIASFRIKTYKNLLPIVTYRFVDDKPQGLIIVVDEVIGNINEKPPCKFDHNAECLICDCWATDCPFIKLSENTLSNCSKLEIHSDKPLMGALNTNYKLDVSGNISDSKS